jgi:stage II sporulation protein D
MRRRVPAAACALGVLASGLIAAAPAGAASRLVIKGRGYGHGVGMSQFGAYGYAQHGEGYAFILGHYYTGTVLSKLGADPDVGVLLQSGKSKVRFSGAIQAGTRKLTPSQTYAITRNGIGEGVVLRSSSGKALAKTDGPLRVTGGADPTLLAGKSGLVTDGRYRGALELRSTAFGINAVNVVELEDYVRGVVAGESPSSWPAEALKAQAVAARTYAVTTDAGSTVDGFTQYADTRSQVYKGVAGETAPTDAAVAATRNEVVTYQGKPVTTFFFSTSGGKTENVENSFIGSAPKPWLKGVDDPYDDASPKHKWGPYRLTMSRAAKKLGGLVPGTLRRIDVVQRGFSPRIVKARIVGTAGTATVDGPTLRKRFGLFDTWATFTLISSSAKPKNDSPTTPAPNQPADPPPGGDGGTGGTGPPAGAAAAGRALVAGRISPAVVGSWARVELKGRSGHWSTVRWAHVGRLGRYSVPVVKAGVYRIAFRGSPGPDVRVR